MNVAEFALETAKVTVSPSWSINFISTNFSLNLSFLPASWNERSSFHQVTVVPVVSFEQTESVVFMFVYEGDHPSVVFFTTLTVAWLLAELASTETPMYSSHIGIKFVFEAYVVLTFIVNSATSVVTVARETDQDEN